MPSIDERVVAMAFENGVFEARVATTMSTLSKLDAAVKNVGSGGTGLEDIEKSANKVTLQQPMSALDKLRARLSGAGDGAAEGFSEIDRAGNRVTLDAPMSALDKLRARLSGAGDTAAEGFSEIDRAANRVTLEGPGRAVDNLQGKLGELGADDSFANIEGSANRVNLNALSSALDGITAKFSVLEGAAAVALGNIATKVASSATNFVKSFSIGPLQQGLEEYGTNLNSIQTILANTQQDGTNLQQVNKALGELNAYSDKTIYNFSEMARNIGTFTAAGVKLEPAVQSIKGIANLAALSGSNSQQASTAMYQLSQAIAAGKVNLQDWNSVVNAGMGGKVFQKALWDTGKAMGTITNSPVGQTFEQWEKAGNAFRQSLSAQQKQATDGTAIMAKAQKDAAESVKNAEESAAESVANAKERVKDAHKGVADAAEQTAQAMATANDRVKTSEERVAETTKQSAEAIKDAKNQVKEAHKGVDDAAKQASEDILNSEKALGEAVKQSATDVQSALDGVTDAQKRLADAMKPPSEDELGAAQDKLKTAQLDQADLADAVKQAQQEQTRSTEDLAAAQKRLADLKTSGASAEEIQSAQRAVEDATRRAADASDAQERALLRQRSAARGVNEAQQDLIDTQKKGTDEDENVKNAKDAVSAALKRYEEAQVRARETVIAAEKRVTEAREKGAELQEQASERLTKAEKHLTDIRLDAVDKQREAAKQLVEAQKGVVKAREDGAEREAAASQKVVEAQKDEVKATQRAQEQVAKAHEQAQEQIAAARLKANQSTADNQMSWLTSDVLTKTLRQFTGEMTDAQLKAMGFNDAQVKAIQQTAKTAEKSATEVKTLGQVFDVAKETMGSGWAKTFQLIFGDFEQAKGTFTGLSNVINGFINTNSDARNKILSDWRELGGRTVLIDGLKEAFKSLETIIKPIKEAFRDIFPAKTGQDLFDLTVKFRDFAKSIAITPETADLLKRTFEGVFAVLHIGATIVGEVFHVIGDLFGLVGDGSGSFLTLTASVGDWLKAVDDALTKGGLIKSFFEGLESVLKVPLGIFGDIAKAIGGLFGGDQTLDTSGVTGAVDNVSNSMKPLKSLLDRVHGAWDNLAGVLGKVKDAVSPMLDDLASVIADFAGKIADGISHNDFSVVFSAIQTTLLGGILLVLKKGLLGGGLDLSGGLLKNINGTFEALTGNLKAMQAQIQAKTLMEIAIAIGVLAAAIVVLSMIDPTKMGNAMTAIAIGMGELVAVLWAMNKVVGAGGAMKLPLMAASLILLAAALDLMVLAVAGMSRLSWDELERGLTGVAAVLASVAAATQLMGPKTAAAGLAMIPIAVGLDLIAVAVKIFATMKWEDLGKGLAGVAGALLAISIGVAAIPPSIILVGPGLVAVGIALTILAGAVAAFGSMKLETLGKGIAAVGAALLVIGIGIAAIPPTIALQAAGLNLLALALVSIAGTVALLGSMQLDTLAKGIAAIGGVLITLAVGLTAMTGTLAGSAALLAAAAALAILGPTIAFLGMMPFSVIIQGLGAIALTIGTLAVVGGLAAAPLALLGAAMVPLGIGFAALAISVYIVAKGLSLLGDEGAKGLAVMVTAMTAFIAMIPTMVISFVKGLVDIIEELAKVAPEVVTAMVKIVQSLLDVVIQSAPKMGEAIGTVIAELLKVLADNAGPIIEAGWKLLTQLLSGIADHIADVTTKVGEIIVNFLDALTKKLPDILAAGAKTLATFLKGIADNLPDVVAAMAKVIVTFLEEVAKHVEDIVKAGADIIVHLLEGVAKAVPKITKAGGDILVSFLDGIAKEIPRVGKSATNVVKKFIDTVAESAVDLADAGFKALIKFLHGIADAIRTNRKDLLDAGVDIAKALVEGIVDGLGWVAQKLIHPVIDKLFGWLPHKVKQILGIESPSKVFAEIGRLTMQGMVVGLTDGGSDVNSTMTSTAEDIVSTAKDTLGKVPNLLDGIMETEPTITPVLDLSQVKKDAQTLGDMTNVTPITAAVSYTQASAISVDKQSAEAAAVAQGVEAGNKIEFNQYNTSPKSLSEIEIYRQTRNQLSQLKSVVGV